MSEKLVMQIMREVGTTDPKVALKISSLLSKNRNPLGGEGRYSRHIEAGVLGYLLKGGVEAYEALSLDWEWFHEPLFRDLGKAMTNTLREKGLYSETLVSEWLVRNNSMERGEVMATVKECRLHSPQGIKEAEAWAAIVREDYEARMVSSVCLEWLGRVDKMKNVAGEIESMVAELETATLTKGTEGIWAEEAAVLWKEEFERLKKEKQDGGFIGHEIFLQGLMKVLDGGWRDGDLIIVAARPSMGKTAFVLCDMIKALILGESIVFVTLEMTTQQLISRLAAIWHKMGLQKMMDEDMDTSDFEKFISQSDVVFIDKFALSIEDVGAELRRIRHDLSRQGKKIDRIYFDYISLATSRKPNRDGNRVQEVSAISRALKGIAKDCSCPVLALSQLSRSVEKRPDKRPMLQDLRESGAIEQDADVVIFLYRAEYYGIEFDDTGDVIGGVDTKDKGEIIVAKHRNGGLGTNISGFNKTLAMWHDLTASDVNPTVEEVRTERIDRRLLDMDSDDLDFDFDDL